MTCRIFKRERSITVTLDECYDKLGTGSIIFLYSESTNGMLCHFIIEYNIGLHRHVKLFISVTGQIKTDGKRSIRQAVSAMSPKNI